MNERYKRLLEPGNIGKIRTKNRIIKTASGTSFLDPSGNISDAGFSYYETLAKGGAGLLIVESCGVEYPLGIQHQPVQYHLDDDKYIPTYSKLTSLIHKHGCPTILQFQHAGPWNPNGLLPKRDTKAASALTKEELPADDFDVPRALSNAEVKEYVNIWVRAAERAAKAGFDGVEINGATCHQINTFFSRIWNRRDDEYGCQSLENRARFMCEIIHETKRLIGHDFTVTSFINIVEYGHEKGTTISEGVEFARLLQEAGADAIQCRAYNYNHRYGFIHPVKVYYPEPPKSLPCDLDWSRQGRGAIAGLTSEVKKMVTVPVFCAGRIDPDLGEQLLKQHELDFIGMTTKLLADPELPNKIIANKIDDIRPCIGCLHCRDKVIGNLPVECQVNLTLGKEQEYDIKLAKKKKKVIVIGGSPSGMEAARVAALRGHDVMLFEKGSRLGGLVPLAALLTDMDMNDHLKFVHYLRNQISQAGVKVIMNKKVGLRELEKYKPDVAVITSTVLHDTFTIPGNNRLGVIHSFQLYQVLNFCLKLFGPKLFKWLTKFWIPIGKRVVVIGGSVYGCELAEFLIKRGRKVTIVHEGKALGDGMTMADMEKFLPWLGDKGAAIHNEVKYQEINDKGLVIITRDGTERNLEADTIIVAFPFLSNIDMMKSLQGSIEEIYDIKPGLIVGSVADGFRIAYKI